jgi:hypothetical protein
LNGKLTTLAHMGLRLTRPLGRYFGYIAPCMH